MAAKFPENKDFNLSRINKDVLRQWQEENTFAQSLELRKGAEPFVFYEGPPSANGKPGIHHVMARAIKDIFCKYKTMRGYLVERKAGWDTHGLPVELSVEQSLGITKEDIGKKISVEEYNAACRKEVMKYTDQWEKLTDLMGYWVDMDNPYITYDNRYIETLWWLLKELYDKDLLYKGFTIQPYSPAAGTGLSTHELNQPGCYRDVKDTTVVAQFKAMRDEKSEFLFQDTDTDIYLLAWTTTPWTLPSNTALAVGEGITYVKVRSFNAYTGEAIIVILAKDLLNSYFPENDAELKLEDYQPGDKKTPYRIISEHKGSELAGIRYEQLIPWVKPTGGAFRVITGDFVSTEDGTGIVHIAPTFGADDMRVGRENGIEGLFVTNTDQLQMPLVDKKGRFVPIGDLDAAFADKQVNKEVYAEFAGRYVKNDYDESIPKDQPTVDVDIAVMLKKENKAFKIEKHEHNYPHCWRTDKPVLYYPLDSWFIRTTAMKDKLIELNKTIQWKPEATGTGRFGQWLENLQDWNLSRSRFWGTPLPIWVSEDGSEMKCIGSVAELKAEIEKSIAAGLMSENPLAGYKEGDNSKANYEQFDLHKPFVDRVVLVSESGQKLTREPDLIDVWFDSGAMPYAQLHYPFEHKDDFEHFYPAHFIAEGVDQTRGWFFTLHAIAGMLFDSVSFKTVVSNGLVLDKKGNKMSKRLGNAIDPFEAIGKYGSDPLRWYMITNAQPWDNLKFDLEGVEEVRRKFFGTLHNTYSFFALYANVDGFTNTEEQIAPEQRPEIDRWIISLLNTLVKDVKTSLDNYEPTRAGRALQYFVTENLSNWYVRLSRKRFWRGDYGADKISAYQTLYTCLSTVAHLMAPISPFYADQLWRDLQKGIGVDTPKSVHLADFPLEDEKRIDKELESRMGIAQDVSSMVLGLRKKVNIRVRQPLAQVRIPVPDGGFKEKLKAVEQLILTEVNVKEMDYIEGQSDMLVKNIKANFKNLGPRFGKMMKQVAAAIQSLSQDEIATIEQSGKLNIEVNGQTIELGANDVIVSTKDIPGWQVASEGRLTVALDTTITDELKAEGIARELVNRIQNLRKESGLEVTDKIILYIEKQEDINKAVERFKEYISTETLAKSIELTDKTEQKNVLDVDIDNTIRTRIAVEKS